MRENVTGNNSSKCILDVLKMADIFLSGAQNSVKKQIYLNHTRSPEKFSRNLVTYRFLEVTKKAYCLQ